MAFLYFFMVSTVFHCDEKEQFSSAGILNTSLSVLSVPVLLCLVYARARAFFRPIHHLLHRFSERNLKTHTHTSLFLRANAIAEFLERKLRNWALIFAKRKTYTEYNFDTKWDFCFNAHIINETNSFFS